jgi:hypothetical protein
MSDAEGMPGHGGGGELAEVMDECVRAVNNVLMEAKQRPATIDDAGDTQHTYADKFALTEAAVNVSTDTLVHLLGRLGLGLAQWKQLADWEREKQESVYLVCLHERECVFLEKKVSTKQPDLYTKTGINHAVSITHKKMTKVTTYLWRLSYTLRLVLAHQSILGECGEMGQVVLKINRNTVLQTNNESPPHPDLHVRPATRLCLSGLVGTSAGWLQEVTDTHTSATSLFTIDREATSCATPRRNAQVDHALGFFSDVSTFLAELVHQVIHPLVTAKGGDSTFKALDRVGLDGTPLPAYMYLQRLNEDQALSEPLTLEHQKLLLDDFKARLSGQMKELAVAFPPEEKSADACPEPQEGHNSLVCYELVHLMSMSMLLVMTQRRLSACVAYVEHMLRAQVVAAVGKVVKTKDFRAYMEFHHRKLFRQEFQPRHFSYAVRRPDCQPEGALSLEDAQGNLVQTVTREVAAVRADPEMCFKIGASTKVRFTGKQHVHGWLSYTFGGSREQRFNLHARARQFSSFILVVGKLLSGNEIDPEYAITVQNKDAFVIPLLKKTLPSAKEFKDAISSLSPEQQRFCKAFRSMQLAGSVLTLCVLQIKPQIERLLRVPSGSLVKEIRLMERVMSLFIKYQVSSDLFTYEGSEGEKVGFKVDAVKANVALVVGEIEEEEKKQLERARQATRFSSYQFGDEDCDDEDQEFEYALDVLSIDSISDKGMIVADLPSTVLTASTQLAMAMPMSRTIGKAPESKSDASRSGEQPDSSSPSPSATTTTTTASSSTTVSAIDFTKMPAQLDKLFETVDSGLRTAKVSVEADWRRTHSESLLSKPVESGVDADAQRALKQDTFDLLDALSRGGELAFLHVDTHIILPSAHSFPDSLMNTVVQRNVNPIERVERSVVMMSSVVLGQSAAAITRKSDHTRLKRQITNSSNNSSPQVSVV